MSDRKLAVLGMLAVLMTGWAIFQNRLSQRSYRADYTISPLIEGLAVEGISEIRIASGDGTGTVDLIKKNGTFVVSELDDYPADVSRINDLITQSLEILALEKVTSDPANHADLEVTLETADNVVEFLDENGRQIVGYAVSSANEKGAFARLLNSDDVYAVQSPPEIDVTPMSYVKADLLGLNQDDIQSVAVQGDDDMYILSCPETGGQITLENLAAGKQLKGTLYQSVFRALTSLQFEDVKGESGVSDLSYDTLYTCKLRDKTVYKMVLAKDQGVTYAKLSADYLDRSPVQKENRVESDEELKEKEAKLMAIDAVNTFNQKHAGWIYVIPSYKAETLTKPLSELIEDIPEPEESEVPDSSELPVPIQ